VWPVLVCRARPAPEGAAVLTVIYLLARTAVAVEVAAVRWLAVVDRARRGGRP
jgi:hypothetical protein